jgi:pimeloyl-ACP methyl ester carboxylesterase
MPRRREEAVTTETRVLRIDAPDADGISLGILERRCARTDRHRAPVLLAHGATFGAELFDLPLPGYSLMSELARVGRVVYALDIRGYGHSLKGKVMNAPPQTHPPFARLGDAVKDIGAAVRFILARENSGALDLIGFSWGTVTAARYASEFPDQVSRLALYAPLYGESNPDWLNRIADPSDRSRIHPSIGAYRLITQADLTQRWNNDLAADDPNVYRDSRLPEVMFETLSALDRRARSRSPAAFRTPAGALVDLVSVFNGRPLYDPGRLVMPTLLVRGAMDTTSTDSDAQRLLSAIASSEKEYCVITPGSHFLCVEKNRRQLYEHLNRFLEPRGIDRSMQDRTQQ